MSQNLTSFHPVWRNSAFSHVHLKTYSDLCSLTTPPCTPPEAKLAFYHLFVAETCHLGPLEVNRWPGQAILAPRCCVIGEVPPPPKAPTSLLPGGGDILSQNTNGLVTRQAKQCTRACICKFAFRELCLNNGSKIQSSWRPNSAGKETMFASLDLGTF